MSKLKLELEFDQNSSDEMQMFAAVAAIISGSTVLVGEAEDREEPDPAPTKKKTTSTKKKTTKPPVEDEQEDDEQEDDEQEEKSEGVTMDDLRGAAKAASGRSTREKVASTLKKYFKTDKLSEIDPEDYEKAIGHLSKIKKTA